MTRKLEETFNLPPMDDTEETETVFTPVEVTDIDEMSAMLEKVDKIDSALAPVKNLEALDADMDKYADEALDAFKDLMDLGNNVEDRHAAPIFDSASKMMANAITAKQSKLDKKLKMIQMQMQKQKLDLEERKLQWQIDKAAKAGEDTDAINGTGEVLLDRNELMGDIMKQLKGESDAK